MRVIVIGGGAAGFFGAITAAEAFPSAEVILVEKSNKLLSKVRISGGGRCNVTHNCFEPNLLAGNYPRGQRELISAFNKFQPKDIIDWFEKRGVELKVEPDGRMFPVTDNSETIINCFLNEIQHLKIKIWTGTSIEKIEKKDNLFSLKTSVGLIECDRLLIATGGNPKKESYNWLEELGHKIESPVPSLFTFNIQDKKLNELLGVSVPKAFVSVQGTKLSSEGPLLITHWGLSGPAILKLSAWGARTLNELNYQFKVSVNWLNEKEEPLREKLDNLKSAEAKKKIESFSPFPSISLRLWKYLIEKAEINEELRWGDASKKNLNKIIEELIRCIFQVNGKSTFKEEFVTCGGVSLSDVDFKTMESKRCKGLFFAGEVLNIDGITGGFNFQSAWSTSWLAGKAIGL